MQLMHSPMVNHLSKIFKTTFPKHASEAAKLKAISYPLVAVMISRFFCRCSLSSKKILYDHFHVRGMSFPKMFFSSGNDIGLPWLLHGDASALKKLSKRPWLLAVSAKAV